MVISNTSPLNYLIQIASVDILPGLYGRIHVPRTVIDELRDPAAPETVSDWASSPPNWLVIHDDPPLTAGLSHLHQGEAAAISLSLQERASLLLIDDLDGRTAAHEVALTVMGTLGILDAAAMRGLGDFHVMLAALLATNFRASPKLIHALKQRHPA